MAASPMSFIVRNTFIEVAADDECDEGELQHDSPRACGRGSSMPPKFGRGDFKEGGYSANSPFRSFNDLVGEPTSPADFRCASPAASLTASPADSSHRSDASSPWCALRPGGFASPFGTDPRSAGASPFEPDAPVYAPVEPQLQGRLAAPTPAAPPYAPAAPGAADLAAISIGSQGHGTRACRPCAFARATAGCKFGAECHFCHVVSEHPETVRVRPCKGKRERLKRQIDAIEKAIAKDPDLFANGSLALPALVDGSSKARARVMGHLAQVASDAYRTRGVAQGSSIATSM